MAKHSFDQEESCFRVFDGKGGMQYLSKNMDLALIQPLNGLMPQCLVMKD